jgi:hypothetical protein
VLSQKLLGGWLGLALPAAQPAKLGNVLVPDLVGRQAVGQGIAVELRVRLGAWNGPDIHHETDVGLAQEIHELRNGSGGVPDGVERVCHAVSVRTWRRGRLGQLLLQASDLLEAAGHVAHHGSEALHLPLLVLERHDCELQRDPLTIFAETRY